MMLPKAAEQKAEGETTGSEAINNIQFEMKPEELEAYLNEYEVTDYYSVKKNSIYPLYGRQVIQNGRHGSDGQFIYIEVRGEYSVSEQDSSEYLVYCPSLSTPNSLIYKFKSEGLPLAFAQIIEGGKD